MILQTRPKDASVGLDTVVRDVAFDDARKIAAQDPQVRKSLKSWALAGEEADPERTHYIAAYLKKTREIDSTIADLVTPIEKSLLPSAEVESTPQGRQPKRSTKK